MKKLSKNIIFLAVIVFSLISLSFVGCKATTTEKTATETTVSATTEAAETTATETTTATVEKKKIKIGYAVSSGANVTVQEIIRGVKEAIAKPEWTEKFDIELIVTDAGLTDIGTKFTSDLEDLYAQGIDALLMFPADASNEAGKVVKELYNPKGIPVGITDIGISEGEYVCFTITDNYLGGQMAAEYAAQFMTKGDKVQAGQTHPGSINAQQRVKGYEDKMKELGMNVLATAAIKPTVESGTDWFEDLLTSDPDIKSSFVVTYPPIIGAAKVVKDKGLAGKIYLTTFDADKVTYGLVEEGLVTVCVIQDMYNLGAYTVEQVLNSIAGLPVTKDILLKPLLLTKDNLAEFKDNPMVQ